VAGLIFTPLAGWLIELGGQLHGYQASFLIAGLMGFIATACFARIPEPQPAPAEALQGRASGNLLSLLRQNPQFAAFTAVAFLWNLAVATGGPYFTVYLVRNLAATPTQIGILATVTGVTTIIGQPVWGRLNDRRGAAWVMRLSGFLIPVLPLMWLVVPDAWSVTIINLAAGFLWAGYGLANFNLMLELAPPAQRSRAVAVYQIAALAAAAAGPLLGSVLIAATTIQVVFVASAAGRLIAAVLFMVTVRGTERPETVQT
jgi:predicted MFS family arabinose efflux permease